MVVQETLEQYHKHPSLGSSMLKVMLESPKLFHAHFIEKKMERKETHALSFGSAIHLALLEPKVFLERYAIEPDVRRNTNVYKEWRAAVLANDPAAVIVSQDDMDNLNGMVESVMKHRDASAMLKKGIPERSIYNEVRMGDVVVQGRARPDWLHDNGDLIDLKTTRDAGFHSFRKDIWDYRYDVSAAWYHRIVELEYGQKPDRYFWWVVVEKTRPWDVCVYRANDVVMEKGLLGWQKAITLYTDCMKSGKWPGKQDAAQDIDLPIWALND
jgi:hypothetical protein